MTRRAALFVLLIWPAALRGADPDRAWAEAVAHARSTATPIVAFERPTDCRDRHVQACRAVQQLLAHPAMQRRIQQVVFLTRPSDDSLALAVHGPAGDRLTSFKLSGQPVELSRAMTLIAGASPHIIAAHQARERSDGTAERRQRALALLALSDAAGGRAVIGEMLESGSVEDRELAAVWLDALTAGTAGRRRDVALLARLSTNGSSPLVRFEALMAHGAVQSHEGDIVAAVRSFTDAASVAPDAKLEAKARLARQQALTRSSSFVGIGEHDGVVIGRRTFKPRGLVRGAVRGEFRLGSRVVAKNVRPPFIVTLDFGRDTRRQELEFRSFDARGRELQRLATVVNERRDAFSIRIVEPTGTSVDGTFRVSAAATVPRGRQIERVAIEWRGETAAALEVPPFETDLRVDASEEGVLRAVIRLDDGSEAEDVRILNSPSLTIASYAHLVEVPVQTGGAIPLPDQVAVRENGRLREVERVVAPKDAPLRIALLLDTSLSMSGHLLDLQESAARFVEQSLAPADRATLIAFGGSESVRWPPADQNEMVKTILSLQTHGGTALYSAIISAFLQLQSPGYRRAIVLFTDGVDTGSAFTLEETEEFARRMAIPLYVLAFEPNAPGERLPYGAAKAPAGTTSRSGASRVLQRISRDSGGEVFTFRSFDEVDSIWSRIADELRRQALIVFRPSVGAAAWRSLDIRADGQRLRGPKGVHVELVQSPQ